MPNIPGDGKTTNPVKQTHILKSQAESLGGRFEITINRSSGHHCRSLEAKFDPERPVMFDRTVSFIADHL